MNNVSPIKISIIEANNQKYLKAKTTASNMAVHLLYLY
jgi:hypothetical protein